MIVKCLGTTLKLAIASVYTPVSQLISLELPEMESQTFEANTLDAGVGIPHAPTGQSEGGSLSGEMFLDPSMSIHQSLLSMITAPVVASWQIGFSDSGETVWSLTGAGFKIGGTVALKEGLKSKFSVKLSGIPSFST